jgi:hypothetical protein
MMRVKCYADTLSNYVRAGSENCSPQLLAELARSEVDRIRVRVAENPFAPLEVLELLATDKNPDVRIAVGTNHSTPTHIKYSFAFDEDPNVRFGLAEDMNSPIELLDKLIDDSNPYVSCRALETKEMILSRGQPHAFDCHRFFRWASKCADSSELRYA